MTHLVYILGGSKFILRPSLAFSYIGTARHSSSGRQPNFVAWHKEWNYGTFASCSFYIKCLMCLLFCWDDSLKPATPLTSGAISGVAGLRLSGSSSSKTDTLNI